MKTYVGNSEQDDLHTKFRFLRPTYVIQDMKTYIHNAAHEDLHR